MKQHTPRFQAYATPNDEGGVSIDLAGMATDLVALSKASGDTKVTFLEKCSRVWDETEINYVRDTRLDA